MEIVNININSLVVSNINARKTQINEITELANSITEYGLINPISVKLMENNNTYEIVAGQRRYLAMKELNKETIPCNVLNIDNEKAKELSLIENIHKNSLSNCDKVVAFSKMADNETLKSNIKISKSVIKKYLKIKDLPLTILKKLDMKGKDKISIDLAVELASLNPNIDLLNVIEKISHLKNKNKISVIKEFKEANSTDIEEIDDIIDNIEDEKDDKLKYKIPFIYDSTTQKNIKIPENMYAEFVSQIKEKITDEEITYL
jgi:ParB family chromosome partitioning protein|uniref:ParB-like N-terminal domain-containing protein n=1 Tax=viral metagenome TaxID=1070528 RepID=A0A6C0DL57_9ZZZZ